MKEISKMMLPALQEAMVSVIFGQNTAKSKWHGWKEPQSEKHKCLLRLREKKKVLKKKGFIVRKHYTYSEYSVLTTSSLSMAAESLSPVVLNSKTRATGPLQHKHLAMLSKQT